MNASVSFMVKSETMADRLGQNVTAILVSSLALKPAPLDSSVACETSTGHTVMQMTDRMHPCGVSLAFVQHCPGSCQEQ